MKTGFAAIVLTAALITTTHCVSAMTGRELNKLCKSTNRFDRGFCTGAIEGFFQGFWRGRVLGAVSGAFWHANRFKAESKTIIILSPGQSDEVVEYALTYCPPEHTTRSRVVTVGVDYLAGHPERGHEDVDDLLPDAFEQAWPCKK